LASLTVLATGVQFVLLQAPSPLFRQRPTPTPVQTLQLQFLMPAPAKPPISAASTTVRTPKPQPSHRSKPASPTTLPQSAASLPPLSVSESPIEKATHSLQNDIPRQTEPFPQSSPPERGRDDSEIETAAELDSSLPASPPTEPDLAAAFAALSWEQSTGPEPEIPEVAPASLSTPRVAEIASDNRLETPPVVPSAAESQPGPTAVAESIVAKTPQPPLPPPDPEAKAESEPDSRFALSRRLQSFIDDIDRQAYYPRIARRRGQQGLVVVGLLISDSTRLDEVRLIRSSSFSTLDQAALRLIQDHRQALEDIIGRQSGSLTGSLQIHLPIRFSLQ